MPFRDDDLFDAGKPEEGGPDRAEELEQRPDRGEIRTREVKVVGIFIEETQEEEGVERNFFVLLRDSQDRQLPMVIDYPVATGLAAALQGERPMRPMTHDLLKNVIERLGARVDSLTIDDLWQTTYYAKLALAVGDSIMDVDTRPSDGIAVALRAGAPIYVSEWVLEEAEKRREGEPGPEPE